MAYKDLNDLYQQVLGRAPDPSGQQYWRTLDVNEDNGLELFKRAAAPELARTGYRPPPPGQTPPPAIAPTSTAPASPAQTIQPVGGSAGQIDTGWNAQNQTYGSPNTQGLIYGQPMNGQPAAGTPQKAPMPGGGKGGNYANTDYAPREAPSGNFNALMGKSGQTLGSQGASTNSATSGQPQMGQPNAYPNTVGMKDNSRNTTATTGGKGKGV